MADSSNQPADTTMMGVVHDALRRDLRRLETALTVDSPADGDRGQGIGDHVLWMMDFLHHHHHTEDVGLWPLVRRRNPAAAGVLDRMHDEHTAIAGRIEQTQVAARRYRSDPGEEARQALTTAVAQLSGPLLAHLNDEETTAMPVVSASITEAEWRQWDQKYNVRGKSLSRLAAEGHWLMDGLDPERYQVLVHLVPAPVRLVILHGYARRYRTACARRWGPQVAVGPAK